MLEVPFTIIDKSGKSHPMKYNVGFIGCDKNDQNEILPVTGWIVSHKRDNEKPREEKYQNDGSDNDEDVKIIDRRIDYDEKEEEEEDEDDIYRYI